MSDEAVDAGELRRRVASCRGSHASLVGWLTALEPRDPTTPSQLPGWSLGHVLTHIARNADGLVGMLDGHPQYPHGADGRTADIEAGSTRGWAALVDDVVATCAAADARLASHTDWSGTATMLSGERPRHLLPLLRQREVEVHRADLGLGYGFADMPADYVRDDLRLMEMLWRARRPMGMTPLPAAALATPPATRLAWMMGRAEIEGVPPAGLL